jgi:hypothetical protein
MHIFHIQYISEPVRNNLLQWRKISLEPIRLRQSQFNNHPMTTHQQTRETHGPEIQVTLRQPTNMSFQMLRHIIVVVALVPQGSHQVQHFGAGVFSLLPETVFEVLWQEFEEVHLRANDIRGYRL